MTKPKDSIDIIEISSSDSDGDYQDSVGDGSDHERDGEEEETETNRRGSEEGKKGAGADVSPSSVQVKTAEDKKVEDDECCILDFDPFESAVTDLANKLSLGNGDGDDREEDDLSVLAEKGEVACRDFPHSRHLCAKFLFDDTPHESYCPQCYCYVCDTLAPCTQWKGSLQSHCHASDRLSLWKDLRSSRRKTEVK